MTIQLATLEDVPHSPARRQIRRYRDEIRRGMWIGPSISIPGSPMGAGAASPPAPTPPTIITSVTVAHWWRADLGVALNAGNVSEWRDQVGTAHFSQATVARQPAYSAADATFGGKETIISDGVDDLLATTPPTDFNGPVYLLSVMKLITIMNGAELYHRALFTDGAALQYYLGLIYQSGKGANANTSASAPIEGVWARYQDRRYNTVADYIKLGNQPKASGFACPLSTDPSIPFTLAGNTANNTYLSIAYREIIVCNGEPSAAELTAIDNYFKAQYPGILV